jgi:hypothetical protein
MERKRTGKRSYEIFSSLLVVIQNFTNDTKYLMETTPSTKFGVEFFNHVTWVFGLCIAVWPYLWSVLTIDVIILSSQYDDKLFMAYAMMQSNNYYHLHLL